MHRVDDTQQARDGYAIHMMVYRRPPGLVQMHRAMRPIAASSIMPLVLADHPNETASIPNRVCPWSPGPGKVSH